ncbi:MAG: protein translocase subunit SecF [Bacteriovoracaceae bacterium]|nr:protein translocase subunit SecF [Bacteriovoracaceae bacterium]
MNRNIFGKDVNYVGMFKMCIIASIVMMSTFAFMFFKKGLNYGVDFRGGAEIQIRFQEKVDVSALRNDLVASGVPVSSVQEIGEGGKEVLLKVQSEKDDLNVASTKVSEVINQKFGAGQFEILKNDIVGPKAGEQLRNSGFKAMAWAMLAIMIYLALRFDYKYAPGAIVALCHDVTFIVGMFILTQKEFSLQIVAALLAVIGYSVNDTVVIYDRVRELENLHPQDKLEDVVNRAVNETMSRTVLTAGTTFIVCLVMWVMGGGVIHDFFFALTLGVAAGTYSTVFIASPITIALDRMGREKEAARASTPKAV